MRGPERSSRTASSRPSTPIVRRYAPGPAACTLTCSRVLPSSAASAAAGLSFTAVLGIRVNTNDRVEVVLEAAGLDRAVDPALLRRVRLPPPAAGPVLLAGPDRASAGRAADRRVAAVVQGVV